MVRMTPTFTSNGNVRNRFDGAASHGDFAAQIDSLLAESGLAK